MPFKYSKVENKVVFTRLKARFSQFMFLFMGVLFSGIGYAILFYSKSSEMPMVIFQYFIPLMGALGIYTGIIMPKTLTKTTPDEIIFDNSKGRIEINQKNSEINTAYIYYDEVSDFKIEAKKTSSDSNNSSRSYYSYHVYLAKKDGGQWELLKRNSQAGAENEIFNLQSLIDLSKEPQRVASNFQTISKYNLTKGSQKLDLAWQNKIGLGPLYLGLFAGIFIAVGYAILSSEITKDTTLPGFAYFVIGFIAIVFVLVIVGNALKMIKNAQTIYCISITNSALIYFEKDLSERIIKETRIPMTELHSISFSFDSESNLRKLFIYTASQFEKKNNMQISFSLDIIKQMYDLYKNVLTIEIQSLTPVEALHLESYLQQQIKEIGGSDVR